MLKSFSPNVGHESIYQHYSQSSYLTCILIFVLLLSLSSTISKHVFGFRINKNRTRSIWMLFIDTIFHKVMHFYGNFYCSLLHSIFLKMQMYKFVCGCCNSILSIKSLFENEWWKYWIETVFQASIQGGRIQA